MTGIVRSVLGSLDDYRKFRIGVFVDGVVNVGTADGPSSKPISASDSGATALKEIRLRFRKIGLQRLRFSPERGYAESHQRCGLHHHAKY